MNGRGVDKSIEQAFHYLELAKANGYPNSEIESLLGYCYDFKILPSSNSYEKALHYYKLAAAKGNSKAITSLGYFHHYGLGMVKSIAKAVEYYKEASKYDDPFALALLGECYENGIGLEQSPIRL